jgi:hypothetical protein
MEFYHRLRSFEFFGRISARVRALSPGRGASSHAAARVIRFRKRLGGLALVMTALTLGFWAHDLAQAEALAGWLRGHPPSARMWRHALLSRGLHELQGAGLLQKTVKTLPTLMDEEGAVWVSADVNWIAVFEKQSTGVPQAVYCLECTRPPLGWAPAGNGWDAFDPVLAKVDQAVAGRVAPKRAVSGVKRDPREIVY